MEQKEKFKDKYRIPSARLQNWDYGSNGAYFITICTAHRHHYFGEISSRFIASDLGILAQQYWTEIPNQFPFVDLGNFVIMPNHVHGILMIDKNTNILMNRGSVDHVETRLIASLPTPTPTPFQSPTNKPGGVTGNHNPMFHENISRIVRWYKGRCSFEMRKIHPDFAWQSRFYDRIIRDDQSFHKITEYIINNPIKWQDDKFYSE